MEKKSALILGSLAIDRIETPNQKREGLLGGSLIHALIAAGAHIPVHPVGIVGSDFPHHGWKVLEKNAVNLNDIQEKDGPSFQWGGRYNENWNERETLYTKLGVFADFTPHLSNKAAHASIVFLANIQPSLQRSVLDQCVNSPLIIMDTMNLWIRTARDELEDVIRQAHVLLISDEEACQLSGYQNLNECAKHLQKYGPRTVVIKRGSNGSRIYDHNSMVDIPAVKDIKVVDPTGAGDTFGGGLTAGLFLGQSMTEAVSLGTAWASACVEGFGVESILKIDAAEIDSRKAEVMNGVRT